LTTTDLNHTHSWENGYLLVSSIVYWSERPVLGLFPEAVSLPVSSGRRHQYQSRPEHVAASFCSDCDIYRSASDASCRHEFVSGFLFTHAKLLWWEGTDLFTPGFLFPFKIRSKDGREPRVIFRPPRLALSTSACRCPSARCARCGTIEIRSWDRPAA